MLLTLILTLTLSHYLTLSHSHTLSISHWITLDMLNNFCFHLYAQKSLSHSHTLTLSSHSLISLFHSLLTCWTTFVFMSMLKSHSLTITLSHSHTLSLSHSHTLTLFQSLIHSLSTCWTTFVFMSMLKSHSHTPTLSHSHSLTLSLFQSLIHSLSTCWTTFVFMSMLKSRCLKLKMSMLFFDLSITLTCEFRVHRAGSQLKMSDKSLEPGKLSKRSHPHSLSLDMLNNFCFHVYAQKSLTLSLSMRDADSIPLRFWLNYAAL